MISNSFGNELRKQAGFLTALAPMLEKFIPSALTGIQSAAIKAGLGNVGTAKMIGAGVGAAGGALAGGNVGPEENKGRNRLLGAIAGGVAGSMGGGKLVPKVQSFGSAAGPALKALGGEMAAGTVTGKNMLDYMATKWGPRIEKATHATSVPGDITRMGVPTPTPTAQIGTPGFKQTKSALGEITHPAGKTLGIAGDLAQNFSTINKRGLGTGTSDVLKGNWRSNTFTEKTIGDKNYLFERSAVGKVVGPALGSGLGMGALTALTTEGKNGEKPTISKRLLSGGSSALAWGTAPQLMMGKMLAYDVPKTLIGMKKPKATEIPTTIN
jgi:hypothetical protein